TSMTDSAAGATPPRLPLQQGGPGACGVRSSPFRKNPMPKVLISPREVAKFRDKFRDVLEGAGLEVVVLPPAEANQPSEDELLVALHGIEAVVAGSEPYTPRVLAANRQLRVIARCGVGYDAVDLPASTANGTAVCIAPGTNQGSVAEHTFALILGFTRHIPARPAVLAGGGWTRLMSQPLRGRTLGLAGLGRIGKAVATRAAAFEVRVIAFDPFPDHSFCKANGIALVSFEQLL